MTEYVGPSSITQLRMARTGLGWSQERLARAAGVPLRIYQGIEEGRDAGIVPAMAPIREALERAGVEFIEENGGGAGVRLRL